MFGNLTAQAGVISTNISNSPNFITPKITWNFSGVLVMDFNPHGASNINDRPRINIWRTVNNFPNFDYIQYISGGKDILSPFPSGQLIQLWGDRRTGEYTFPTLSITSSSMPGAGINAGIDLFTFPYIVPIQISPSIDKWVTGFSNPGEIQYQYKFTTGETNPEINIVLDYKPECKPLNVPDCHQPNQKFVYLGLNANGCPTFQCETFNTFIENGNLYNSNTWTSGPGVAYGNWLFISGFNSFRNISNSTQNGRQSIGNQAFFMVGNSGNVTNGHTGIFILNSPMNQSGQFISLDANYSWFNGERIISFWSGNKNVDEFLKIFHNDSNGNALIYTLSTNLGSIPFPAVTITGDAYNKAFTYKLTNKRTGLLFEVFNYGQKIPLHSRNIFYSELYRIQFHTNLSNVSPVDWNNYGMYFNNITYFSGVPELQDWVLNLEITDLNNSTLYLGFQGSKPDFTINWGDGLVEQFTEPGNIKHKYNNTGNYTMLVKGSFLTNDNYNDIYIGQRFGGIWGFPGSSWSKLSTQVYKSTSKLPFIPGLRKFNFFAFYNDKLSAPMDILANNPQLEEVSIILNHNTINNAFQFNTGLRSIELYGNYINISNSLFLGNTNLNLIDIIAPNLISLPEGLFVNNIMLDRFSFAGCSSLQTLPQDLFYYNPNIMAFSNTFNGCSNLTSIPSGLFIRQTRSGVTWTQTFENCRNLTGVPNNLFSHHNSGFWIKAFDGVPICVDINKCLSQSFTRYSHPLISGECTFDIQNKVTGYSHCLQLTTGCVLFSNNVGKEVLSDGYFTYDQPGLRKTYQIGSFNSPVYSGYIVSEIFCP